MKSSGLVFALFVASLSAVAAAEAPAEEHGRTERAQYGPGGGLVPAAFSCTEVHPVGACFAVHAGDESVTIEVRDASNSGALTLANFLEECDALTLGCGPDGLRFAPYQQPGGYAFCGKVELSIPGGRPVAFLHVEPRTVNSPFTWGCGLAKPATGGEIVATFR